MIWELAGVVGVNPGPLTLRELIWMAEAKSRSEWSRISAVLALIANVNRDPKQRAFTPDDFSPHKSEVAPGPAPKMKDLSILKQIFIDKNREVKKCQLQA